MNGYYNQLCDVLRQHGWSYFKQGKGSHEKWKKGSSIVLVPFNWLLATHR